MIATKQATQGKALAASRASLKAPAVRSVRVRVSTQEDTQADAAPKVDFTPNTQAVSLLSYCA